MNVINIKGLNKYYTTYTESGFFRRIIRQHILKEFDLVLNTGEILGVVGESGSGKSTLANIIMGLTPYDSGEVSLFGEDISSINKHERKQLQRKCQFIFQNPYGAFNLLQPIGSALHAPLVANGIVKSKNESMPLIYQMMDDLGLDRKYITKLPTELSGGELQRVSIIRALLLSPDCLVCDEVISSLDVSLQLDVLKIIQKQAKEKEMACLFITHNIATIKNFANRILVMKDGKIIEEGSTKKIISNPISAYTKELIQGIPNWLVNLK